MALKYTEIGEIKKKINRAKQSFTKRQFELAQLKNGQKEDLRFRISQLNKLYYALKDNEEEIVLAMQKDFNRTPFESVCLELVPLYGDLLKLIEILPDLIKDEKIKESSPIFGLSKVKLQRIALGTVLVISPSNFPVNLAMNPIAGAIAGGNTVVWKPSELTPETGIVLERILKNCLEPGLVEVVQGAVPETSALLKSDSFDKIFYTGSTTVGSIVAQEAAKSLTPCVLELGGKSPVFITENLSQDKLRKALRRTFFSSFASAGQVCVASDFVLVHESQYDAAVKISKEVLQEMWPDFNDKTDFTHMITQRGYEKTRETLDSTRGKKFDTCVPGYRGEDRVIPPTLVFDVEWNDPLMKNENFAPVMPFVKYHNLDDAIDLVLKDHDYPLALYIFSTDNQEIDHIMRRIRSGGCMIGDTMIHVSAKDAPFGGIRRSGYGNYHGKWTVHAFTHERTVIYQPYFTEKIAKLLGPPFGNKKLGIMRLAAEPKPKLGRDGKTLWKAKLFIQFALIGVALSLLVKNVIL
ncbi:LAMI_0G05182g1_1 [Lachancea mirantina]|uniref:Aldehyde dehydrogenase n=1 Tax=Lachancea mirantina TaxID=1230905 RepID=A0A1G4K8V8_9SACH|nr:LAMI_0G05182g1_1 [Lachancea mirantina]